MAQAKDNGVSGMSLDDINRELIILSRRDIVYKHASIYFGLLIKVFVRECSTFYGGIIDKILNITIII